MTDDVARVLPQGTGTPVTVPAPIFTPALDTFGRDLTQMARDGKLVLALDGA